MPGQQGAGLASLSRRSLQGSSLRAQFWLIASTNNANSHTLVLRWLFHVPESPGEGFCFIFCLFVLFSAPMVWGIRVLHTPHPPRLSPLSHWCLAGPLIYTFPDGIGAWVYFHTLVICIPSGLVSVRSFWQFSHWSFSYCWTSRVFAYFWIPVLYQLYSYSLFPQLSFTKDKTFSSE